MSIWGTLWHADNDWHDPDCAVWVEGHGVYYTDPNRACDRSCGPIAYQASHLWPDPSARGGGVEIAAISAELTPDGRDEGAGDGYHPWLRLVCEIPLNRAVVILDRAQVQRLHGALGDWLGRTEVGGPGTYTDSGTQARRR